jgi:hypothetical protein
VRTMPGRHLTVEFDIGDGPVRGIVLGDPPRAFTGWMELIGLFLDLEADAAGSTAHVAGILHADEGGESPS